MLLDWKSENQVRVIMKILLAAFAVVFSLLSSGSWAQSVPILVFHRITDDRPPGQTVTSTQQFTAIADELRARGIRTLKIGELVSLMKGTVPLPQNAVCITFDDGFKDQLTAVSILEARGLSSTLYVMSGAFDDSQYLSRAELKKLAESKLIEIGGHSHTHFPAYIAEGKISTAAMVGELVMSRAILEEVTGRPILQYAWPYGYTTTEAVQFAERLGFQSTALVNSRSVNAPGRTLELQRLNVDGRCSTRQVLRMIRTGTLELCE